MKKTQIKNSDFTLIELLVVIAIIVILAGLLFPAINAVRARAKEVKAKTMVNAIALACKSYEGVYGLLPYSTATTPLPDQVEIRDGDFDTLIQILTCLEGKSGGAMLGNERNQKFLEPPPRYGTGGTDTDYVDPFGKKFVVILDTNYDGDVTFGGKTYKGSVFVYSFGPDQDDDAGIRGGPGTDDVASWD